MRDFCGCKCFSYVAAYWTLRSNFELVLQNDLAFSGCKRRCVLFTPLEGGIVFYTCHNAVLFFNLLSIYHSIILYDNNNNNIFSESNKSVCSTKYDEWNIIPTSKLYKKTSSRGLKCDMLLKTGNVDEVLNYEVLHCSQTCGMSFSDTYLRFNLYSNMCIY